MGFGRETHRRDHLRRRRLRRSRRQTSPRPPARKRRSTRKRRPSSASTTWAEFRRHVEVSAKDIGTTRVEFDGIDIYNDDAVNAKTLALLRSTDSESEWLDTHPPDACYAETHASWSSAMAHIGQAASLFREAVAEHDDSKFKSGNEALTQGVAEAKKMTDSIPTSSFACAT